MLSLPSGHEFSNDEAEHLPVAVDEPRQMGAKRRRQSVGQGFHATVRLTLSTLRQLADGGTVSSEEWFQTRRVLSGFLPQPSATELRATRARGEIDPFAATARRGEATLAPQPTPLTPCAEPQLQS